MTMEEAEEAASHEPLLSAAQKPAEDALHFCEELIRDFRTRADRHKRIFKLLRYLSITLAIAVTVVSTLTVTQRMLLWIVPLISALSALCTTLLSTTNSQERWIHSRGVQQQFEAERFLYLQRAGSYAQGNRISIWKGVIE
jgi:hypothetical protein